MPSFYKKLYIERKNGLSTPQQTARLYYKELLRYSYTHLKEIYLWHKFLFFSRKIDSFLLFYLVLIVINLLDYTDYNGKSKE